MTTTRMRAGTDSRRLAFLGRRVRAAMRLACACLLATLPGLARTVEDPAPAGTGHYLFAWAGDVNHSGDDFLAVIDADPSSASYGQLKTSIATDQRSSQVHHTEYTMPAGGLLFANDHKAGRTFIFDLRDPLHPRVAHSFTDLLGYAHPHSFARLPNGHVLATFQHELMASGAMQMQEAGGLVEIDDDGKAIRAASSFWPILPGAMLQPYSLVVVPEIDRVLVTNSSMNDADDSGHTFQVWRLSDLKLLRTEYFDPGGKAAADINPEEPRRGPDGSVYVQTLGCGLERVTGLAGQAQPVVSLVYKFPGSMCGVPTVIGHYLVQSVPRIHGLIAVDLSVPDKPVEVSRLVFSEAFQPHWTAWDERTKRLAVTGYGDVHRVYLVEFDAMNGALSLDNRFQDSDGTPGFSLDHRRWPHGWTGTANAHGVVFSR